MTERDHQGLADILEFAQRAIRLLAGRDLAAFLADEATLYGVRYCILVIGETAGDLSPEAKSAVSGIPWPQVIAMRHRLAHNYRAITDTIVYDTVVEDLPALAQAVRSALGPEAG